MASFPSLPSLPSIPTPVTSVRTTQGIYNGAPVTIDGLGNMTDSEGNPVGTLPGTASTTVAPSTNTTTTDTTDILAGISSWLSSNTSSSSNTSDSSGWLSRGVFVVLGMVLIAAGVFSFKSSQTIIETVGKGASKIAEVTG